MDQLLLFVVSLIANLFSAFSGGGGGLLQLPVLIFLGLPFAVALATHKVASLALGAGATLRHLREDALEGRFALFILASGLPGVVVGAYGVVQVPDHIATATLGVLILGLGLYSWWNKGLGQKYHPVHRDRAGMLWGGLVLFLLGMLNGSLTSGTGLLVTLWQVRWFGLDYQRAVTYTLVIVGLFWNSAGALTLGMLVDIKWDWLAALLAGSLIGGYLGAHLAIKHGNRWIKRLFEIVCVLVGLKLIIG